MNRPDARLCPARARALPRRALALSVGLAVLAPTGAGLAAVEKIQPPVEVVAVRNPDDPIVNLRVLFDAGSRDDPPGQEGLTALTAELMTEAVRSHSSSELKEALFPWAAELGVQVDKDTTVFTGRVHRDHLLPYLSLFLQVLQAPRFAERDFERVKEAQENALTRQLRTANDELLVRELLEAELYHPPGRAADAPRHPYRHPPVGTEAGLASITLDDVKAHRERVFTRDRVTLGLSGGYDPAHRDLLEAALAALPLPQGKRAALPAAPPIEGTTVLLVDKKAPGTPISLGYHLDVDRTHPDYAALKLAETYFGEHRNRVGHLFNAMREVRGLNYGDYAYVEHFVQAGWSTLEQLNIGREQQYFSIWIRPVEHENRHFALRQAAWELARFAERGVLNQEKLDEIKAFVAGYWRSKEQEPMRRLGYLLDDAWYDQPGARDALKEKVQGLTLEEVNAAVRRHLRQDKLRVVAVTEGAEAFKEALVENRASPIEYPAPVPAWVREEDQEIEVYDLGLDESDVRIVSPDELFAR